MVDEYLEHIVNLFATAGVLSADARITITPDAEFLGLLDADFKFPAGHLLRVALTADLSFGYPVWHSYSFHFQSPSGVCVFRYDMAPHYRELSSFPHHRHLGAEERVLPCQQPTIHLVREELIKHLAPS